MSIRRSLVVAGLFGVVSLVVKPASADLITNGDFQTGTLAGWTVFTTSSNGTNGVGLPAVVSFNTTGSGSSDAAHFEAGEVTFDLTPQGGGLSQTISVSAAGLYTLTEDFAAVNRADVTNGDGGTFSILIDGTTVATDALGAIGPDTTLMGSFDELVNLSAGTHTIETEITRVFQSAVIGGFPIPDQYIDNISLIATPTPEPSSFVLFGTGILGLADAVRRRFNQLS